jgi:two-component system LytT family response regulator
VLRDTKGFTVLKINELIMCEAESYCTQFYLTGNRKITSGKSLGFYEELFSGKQILKVHRSYMVNPNFVKSYSRQGEIFLEENHSCPLGNNYKQQFMDLFKS